ncbi:hypothetical protein ACNKHL_08125 [Shigella flexneri]
MGLNRSLDKKVTMLFGVPSPHLLDSIQASAAEKFKVITTTIMADMAKTSL